MKKAGRIISLVTAIVMCAMLAGCGNAERWAYIHEPETEVLKLSDNGKAVYKGQKYKYTKDDSYIILTDGSGTSQEHRYVMDGEQMIFYESSTYDRDQSEPGEGVTGLWIQDNGWLFQFNADGKFSEENIFFGRYLVDESDHSIKLMYDDPIQDAVLYYSLDGDKLTIEYPWPMVKIATEN